MADRSLSRFDLEELVQLTGETQENLRHWKSLGLIGSDDQDGYNLEDVELVRLVQFSLRHGLSPDAIARVDKESGGQLRVYLELLFPNGIGRRYSLAEASQIAGLNVEQAQRVLEVTGSNDQEIDEADLEMLKRTKVAMEVGFPEEAFVQLLRVYNEALGRVAEANVRLFHFYVHEPSRAAGLSGADLLNWSRSTTAQLLPMIEPMLAYFHGKGRTKAVREDMVMHLAEEDSVADKAEAAAQLRLAIVFVDLSSFTPMTEAMGDVAAAQVVRRFSELVHEATKRWEGRVVERIGDAFLLVFPKAAWAVTCALEIERLAAAEPQFLPVRCGAHWGQILYREGGYVGTNVNIASRVAAEARRHQILVTDAIRAEAGVLPGAHFTPRGKRRLKGVTDELEIFEVRSRDIEQTDKVLDVVCGMELSAAEVAARISLGDEERAFCSEKCLRMFIAAPEKYRI